MTDPTSTRRLFAADEIAAAGAEAVKDWKLSDAVRDRLVALFAPTVGRPAADSTAEHSSSRRAA